MLLSLSSQNVIQYLQAAGLCSLENGITDKSELPRSSKKNFNLRVKLGNNQQLLVQQEHRFEDEGNPHEFFNEWLFQQLLRQFPVLGNIAAIASLVVHYDAENSILVRNYLSDYLELQSFYQKNDIFPTEIATAIGKTIASLHRATFQRREYRDFMSTAPEGQFRYSFYNPAQGIDTLTPEIFGAVPKEALQFYTYYQRYECLESAIADLAYEWKPCCLTHNDLTLSNILLHSRWDKLDNCLVKLIDWEACAWGDPTFDLGTLIASYLKIWLSSLVVDPMLDLEESLQLAVTPLEVIQPSLLALIRAYLNEFPAILEHRQDFLARVIQFAGLGLIHQLQAKIKFQQHFDNADMSALHLAQNLLTMPEKSIHTVFGVSQLEIVALLAEKHQLAQPQKEQKLVRLYYEKTRLRGC
ncbi:aminoglycoside phosphotransferase family protein [Nostoc sp. FACHB-152]|uniref:phosphotransferase family protein n=1 Tax=unclassified Nostoc TaxID=2593658 RepID=UPI0016884FB0|nr:MULTISPECIES: aminoglycoside phosphotransferase family protein [unclassified Nostoc]MBD2445972.1 aminoglycoside phosphotransferase family protein [Nostoc sp. FACHB-152]MBD2467203.1 aminoglycoside phosphotransferase family protein [Nostoc sp. FACHB-145]